MKQTSEEKRAISLEKEYKSFLSQSEKTSSKIEKDYFMNMAISTKNKIDYRQLQPKKKKESIDGSGDYKDSFDPYDKYYKEKYE